MTGFERFIDSGKKAAKKAKSLPVIDKEKLKDIPLFDAPAVLPKRKQK